MEDTEEVDVREIEKMATVDFDALPFGAIRVDADGRVLAYNATESKLARRDKDRVMGQRFFEDVAPCTNVARFRGQLDELVRAGGGSTRFDFRFMFPWGDKLVRIRLVVEGDARWIFVSQLD